MIRPLACLLAAALPLSLLPGPAKAAEGYANCTGFIDTLPAVIGTSGTWCLRQHLSTGVATGSAILVGVNNVTIDCNDFRISNLAAGAGTGAHGIRANNRSNIIVRGCNLRGFASAVTLYGDHAIIEDNRIDGSTQQGIGITGFGYTVRRNVLADIGGSTITSIAFGIAVTGTGDVIDNTVNGMSYVPDENDNGHLDGIRVADSLGGSVKANRIRELDSTSVLGSATGISVGGTSKAVAVDDNVLVGDFAESTYGILALKPSSAVCKDNVVQDFQSNMTCTDAGGNFVDYVFDES
jgi:hypothetical protein